MMQTHVRPARDLRNNYAEIAGLIRNHDHVIITNHGRGESILISIDEYAQYEEYLHLRYVEQMLGEAEYQAADPSTKWVSHEDVWKHLRDKHAL